MTAPVSTLTAAVYAAGRLIRCEAVHLVLDEAWNPRAAAQFTVPYTPENAVALDPRPGEPTSRVQVRVSRHWHAALTLDDLTDAWAGLTLNALSAQWAGKTLDNLTTLWGRQWGQEWRPADTIVADLDLRERIIDYAGATIAVRAASDELILQDAHDAVDRTAEPVPDRLLSLLVASGITLTAPPDFTAGASYIAPAAITAWSRSLWDAMSDVAAAVRLRLYCDEARVWRLVDPEAPPVNPPVAARTNPVTNPRGVSGGASWAVSATGGMTSTTTYSLPITQTIVPDVTTAYRRTINTGPASAFVLNVPHSATSATAGTSPIWPVRPGDRVSAGVLVRSSLTGAGRTTGVQIGWRDAGNVFISWSSSPTIPSDGQWHWQTVQGTAPAGAVYAYLAAGHYTQAMTYPYNLDTTAAAVRFGTLVPLTPGDYFDGTTPDTDRTDHAWTGTANASTSTATPTAVVLDRVVEGSDHVNRDSAWTEALVWVGTGTNDEGLPLTEVRVVPDPPPPAPYKSTVEERDYGVVGAGLPMPSFDELDARLAVLQARDRVLTLTATADPTVRPRVRVLTGPPSLPTMAAVVSRVEWTVPGDRMTVTTRDTTEV